VDARARGDGEGNCEEKSPSWDRAVCASNGGRAGALGGESSRARGFGCIRGI